MKRTENLYKELKEKIENLVEFMVSNDLNAADINLEISEEFTICNVKYKDCDDIKDEFLYLYDSSEKLKESYYEKLKLKESGDESHNKEEDSIPSLCKSKNSNETQLTEDLTINEVQNDESEVASNTTSETKGNEVVANTESNVEDTNVDDAEVENVNAVNEADDLSCEDKKTKPDPTEKADDSVNQNNTNKNNLNKNNKDRSKQPINFKEEIAFQKELILSVLKEYNLIS